jgi:hypothetical protein
MLVGRAGRDIFIMLLLSYQVYILVSMMDMRIRRSQPSREIFFLNDVGFFYYDGYALVSL